MNNIKKIVLTIFIIIGMVFYINDDAISAYAVDYNDEVFKVGNIYKSGDHISMRDTQIEEYDSGWVNTYNLNYIIEYFHNGEQDYNLYTQMSADWSYPYDFIVPQYEGEDVYWKVTAVSEPIGEYHTISVKFETVSHEEPVFTLGCDKDTINAGQSTNCTVGVEFKFPIDSVDLTLDVKEFAISDEINLGKWMFVRDTNVKNKYLLENPEFTNFASASTKQNIFQFTLTAPKDGKTTSLKDNVKIKDIEYTDVFVENEKTDDVKTTLNMKEVKVEPKKAEVKETPKEEPKKEEPKVEETKKVEENPKTGIKNYQVLIFIISLICVASVYFFKKKNYLNKI